MLKKISPYAMFCIAMALCATNHAADGDFVWAKGMGGMGNDQGHSVAVDAVGNLYTTGYFQGTVDFDPGAGTFNLTSAGGTDIIVSKLDASGNLVWAKAMGGMLGHAEGQSITLDASGNVYTLGNFWGTVDFDPSLSVFNLSVAGSSDVFVTKFDDNGDFIWAIAMGGASNDAGNSIAIDVMGNVYTTGYFMYTADFDPGVDSFNLSPAGSADIFVCKLDLNGNFVWAKAMGGTNGDEGKSLTVDASGSVYTTGYFQETADFDPGTSTFSLNSAGIVDIYVSKLDTSGNFIWAKRMGGMDHDFGTFVAVDALGNLYTAGHFMGTVDFDPSAGIFNLTSTGVADIFISKLDANGNLVWAKEMVGTGGATANSIALDVDGNVFTTGWFGGTVDFDPGVGTFNLTSAESNNDEIFVSKLDTSGNFIWAKAVGGTGNGYGQSVAVDALRNVYATGYFGNTVDFDPNADVFNLTSAGDRDIFVLKLSGEGEGEGEGEIPASISVNPSTGVDFGDLSTGDSVEQTIVVSNTGEGTLTGSLSITGNGFTIAEDPSFSLGAGATATFNILFSTIEKGPVTGILAIISNGGATITLNFTANVVANSPFACGLSSGSEGNFGGDAVFLLLCLLVLGFAAHRIPLAKSKQ